MSSTNNNNDLQSRLNALEQVRDVFTPEEYQERRNQIIDSHLNNAAASTPTTSTAVVAATATPAAAATPVAAAAVAVAQPAQGAGAAPTATAVSVNYNINGGGAVAAPITVMKKGKPGPIRLGHRNNLGISVRTNVFEGHVIRAGQDLVTWNLSGAESSKAHTYWLYVPADQTIILASHPELCLTAGEGNGAAITLQPKLAGVPPTANQRWAFTFDGTIHLASDRTRLISVENWSFWDANSYNRGQRVAMYVAGSPTMANLWKMDEGTSAAAAVDAAMPTAGVVSTELPMPQGIQIKF